MAGDWIKMEHDLPDKPEVIAIATRLGIDRDAVVGKLHRVWSWFDRQTKAGKAHGVPAAFIDSLVLCDGFAENLQKVGWLRTKNGCVCVPKFDRHISKSAKSRALGRERVKRSRNATNATEALPDRDREIEIEIESEASVSKAHLRSEQGSNRIRDKPPDSDSADLRFSEDEIQQKAGQLASELFRKIRYSGSDGGLLWQAAILVRCAGKIPEAWVRDAAEGTSITGKGNLVAYFRKVLEERCAKANVNLKVLLGRLKIPKARFTSAPQQSTPRRNGVATAGELLAETLVATTKAQ